MTIHYRVATIADLAVLLELVQEFHDIEHLAFDATLDRTVFSHFLMDEARGQAWLIQQDDEVIGYLVVILSYSLEYRGRDAFIDEFYIRAEHRGQGIGTQALAFAEDACRALGVCALHLEVDFDNPKAQHLYSRVGYQRHDRFLMTKQLAQETLRQ